MPCKGQWDDNTKKWVYPGCMGKTDQGKTLLDGEYGLEDGQDVDLQARQDMLAALELKTAERITLDANVVGTTFSCGGFFPPGKAIHSACSHPPLTGDAARVHLCPHPSNRDAGRLYFCAHPINW